jgi:uncharacterized protein (TIGR03437 family)
MLRFVLAFVILLPFSFGQNLPAFRWVQQLDNSGVDTVAGIGTDALGNIYIAGSTLSPNFPVKAAVQNALGSSGLYRIDASTYTRLGSGWVVSSPASDPRNPNIFYAVSSGSGLKSVDGGNTWTALTTPSTQIRQFVVDPVNDQNVYAATFDLGVLKSADGGATWNLINNGIGPCKTYCGITNGNFGAWNLWIDPNTSVLFVYYGVSLARSADGGASWQVVGPSDNGFQVYFDTPNPGVLYWFTAHYGAFKSTDDGQTFQPASIPVNSIFADPNQRGRLLGNGAGGVFESLDDGVSWTLQLKFAGTVVAADWASGFLYASAGNTGIVRISTDLKTVAPVGPPVSAQQLVVAGGHAYIPNSGGHNAYVTKLDPSGNVVYSTYFGGSGEDVALAMTVDPAGNVYVTGTTSSQDFPTTKGVYSTSTGNNFLFKLNPDGLLGYATYFPAGNSAVAAIAVDGAGSAYVTGYTNGNLPTTPGAYQTVCGCAVQSSGFLIFFTSDAFLTKFDPAASTLVYSTYLGAYYAGGKSIALGADGSSYIASGMGNATTLYHLNASGSSLLATVTPRMAIQAIAISGDGSVYLAGDPDPSHFQATAGAFQTNGPALALPYQSSDAAAIVKMDSQVQNVLAATYFGGPYGPAVNSMSIDASGNVYIAGGTPPHGLPTRTPLVEAFGPASGFLSEFSGDLSGLLFSTYLGDTESFSVQGVALGEGGSVIIGGTTGVSTGGPKNVYVNSLLPSAPPALRVDKIVNAASLIDGPLSAGETIVVRGAGFGSDAQLMIGATVVPAISMTATQIVAVVPSNLPNAPVAVQVQSGGAASNVVPVPVAAASPGVFSADSSGLGQGYILNPDGTLNTPSNPAKPGDKITIFANGVGPVSFTNGYAVTGSPVNVFIDGFYASGVAAVMGPVAGFPGSVYQITVIVPNFAAINPDLKNSTFPPLLGLVLQVAGNASQIGLSISVVGEGS